MTRQRLRERTQLRQSQTLAAACELLYQLAFKATMPAEAVNTERGAVLSEQQARDTPDYCCEVRLWCPMTP